MLKSSKRPQQRSYVYFPIALKLAACITTLFLLFMGWVTWRAVQIAELSQDLEVNKSGVQIVCALSSLIQPEWLKETSQLPRLEEELSRFIADAQSFGIRAALIYDNQDRLVATGRNEKRIWVSQESRAVYFQPAVAAQVRILEFQYQGEPIRSFRRAIPCPGSPPPEARCGAVEVLLSADEIRRSREDVRGQMLALSAMVCFAAAVGSFLLAALLTRPIRTLVKDMSFVSLGNLDHQSSVRSADELGNLARALNHMTASLREAQEAIISQKQAEQELALATQIQERLLPRSIPDLEGLDIAAFYQPARQVGGDYYDFIPIDGTHIGLVVADVSGKGIPGSLIMAMTRNLLRLAAKNSTSPIETVARVHEELAPDLNPGMFVTLLYVVLRTPDRRIQLVRAGHPFPLLFAARSGKMHHLSPRGIALGLNREAPPGSQELELQSLALHPGDILVLYTDGIVEEKNSQEEEFSEERLARAVLKNHGLDSKGLIEAILADVEAHRGDGEQRDDRTLVVIKCRQ